jgi:hypothetical protein
LATLQSALGENNSHAEKIRRAVQILAPLVPLTVESFSGLGDETIMVVDQLIYRFTKMQDSLGTRFLPALYALLEDDDRPRPFLDILNRLEQLRVVEDVATWQFFRDLRNRLAHDYPESIQQTIATLNLLHADIERFLGLYEVAKAACVSRL